MECERCIFEGTAYDGSIDSESICQKGDATGPESCGNDGRNP